MRAEAPPTIPGGFALPVPAPGGPAGFLVAYEREGARPAGLAVAQHLATVAALRLAMVRGDRETLRREGAETLAELLQDVLDPEGARRRLARHGIEGESVLLVVRRTTDEALLRSLDEHPRPSFTSASRRAATSGERTRMERTDRALRMDKPVRNTSAVILFLVIAGALLAESENIGGYIRSVGLVTLLFSVLSLTIGYVVPRLAGVGHRQCIASCMEIGIHNSTLSITIALSLLDSSAMAIPSVTYGVLMFFTAAGAGILLRRTLAREQERGDSVNTPRTAPGLR